MTATTRAGLYERVSRVARADRKRADKRARSIEQQNAANRAACALRGWAIAATYQDAGRSASRFTMRAREDYDRMLADVEGRRLDVLIFWEGSRGGRELEAWAHLINACRRAGVRIYITDADKLYDPDDPDDERELGQMGVASAAESAKTSARCLRAAGTNAAEGRPHGRTPYGYARRYDPEDGELIGQVADPAAAPVVAGIIGDIAAGQPVSAIVRALNAGAVPGPTGAPWTRTQVTRIARNVVYVGKRRHNGGPLLDGDWPAIVDPGIFRDAQAVMAKRAGDGTRAGAQKWLLSYLGVCAVCGAGLGVRSRDGHLMYGCSNPAGGHCYARAD
ncbi:MAG: recombinase family protein, partial [Streptosporangiaceae bacterium]